MKSDELGPWNFMNTISTKQHGAVVARGAHNPEVTRSKRVAAIRFFRNVEMLLFSRGTLVKLKHGTGLL